MSQTVKTYDPLVRSCHGAIYASERSIHTFGIKFMKCTAATLNAKDTSIVDKYRIPYQGSSVVITEEQLKHICKYLKLKNVTFHDDRKMSVGLFNSTIWKCLRKNNSPAHAEGFVFFKCDAIAVDAKNPTVGVKFETPVLGCAILLDEEQMKYICDYLKTKNGLKNMKPKRQRGGKVVSKIVVDTGDGDAVGDEQIAEITNEIIDHIDDVTNDNTDANTNDNINTTANVDAANVEEQK